MPSFTSQLSNVMARAGQKVRLECTVAGLPFPSVHWLHNNKLLKETRDTRVSTLDVILVDSVHTR